MSAPPARDESLTGRTLSGLRWSYMASGVNAFFQVAFTAVLARLLLPEAFGVVAMAAVILRFGAYFAQMGVGRAVVQRLDLTQKDERAAFTASALLGAAFTALFWVAAPLALYIFDDPEVVPILRVTSLSFVIIGLSTTSLALLQRQLRFRAIAMIEIASYAAVYGPVGIVLALYGAGPWSLVAAGLGQSLLTAILAYGFSRHSLRPSLGRAATASLLSFGARVSGISLVEFLTLNLNSLWIGNRLGATPLGVYNRAFSLVNAPAYYFTTSLSRVLFSSLSRVQTETAKLRSTYLSVTTVFAALLMPVCWGAAAASREIVLVLLGPNWTEAVPVFAILAAAAPFTFLAVLSGVMCEVTATLNPKLLLCLGKLGLLVVLLIALAPLGLVGYTLAYAVVEILGYLAYFLLMRSVLGTGLARQAGVQVPGLVVGLATAAAMAALGRLGQAADAPLWATLAVQLTTGGIILLWATLRGFSGAVWVALGTGLRWSERIDASTRLGRLLLWLDAHAARPDRGWAPPQLRGSRGRVAASVAAAVLLIGLLLAVPTPYVLAGGLLLALTALVYRLPVASLAALVVVTLGPMLFLMTGRTWAYTLTILGPASLGDVILTAMALAIAARVFLLVTRTRAGNGSPAGLSLFFALLVGWAGIAILRNIDAYGVHTIGQFRYSYLILAAPVFAAVFLTTAPHRRRFFVFMIAFSVGVTLAAVPVIGLMKGWAVGETSRFLPAPVSLGMLYGWIALLLGSESGRLGVPRWLPRVLGVPVIALVVADSHRSVWLSAAVLIVVLLALERLPGRVRYRIVVVSMAGVALLMVVAAAVRLDVVGYVATRSDAIVNPASDPTSSWRLDLWSANVALWSERPLTGAGFGGYYAGNASQGVAVTLPPHSLPIETLVSMGAVGLALLVALVVAAAWTMWRALRRLRRDDPGDLDPVYLELGLAIVVSAQAFWSVYSFDYSSCLWVGIGLATALWTGAARARADVPVVTDSSRRAAPGVLLRDATTGLGPPP